MNFILVRLIVVKNVVKGCLLTKVVTNMKETGSMICTMVKEHCKFCTLREFTKGTGKMESLMVEGKLFMRMVLNIKDIFPMERKTVWEF